MVGTTLNTVSREASKADYHEEYNADYDEGYRVSKVRNIKLDNWYFYPAIVVKGNPAYPREVSPAVAVQYKNGAEWSLVERHHSLAFVMDGTKVLERDPFLMTLTNQILSRAGLDPNSVMDRKSFWKHAERVFSAIPEYNDGWQKLVPSAYNRMNDGENVSAIKNIRVEHDFMGEGPMTEVINRDFETDEDVVSKGRYDGN